MNPVDVIHDHVVQPSVARVLHAVAGWAVHRRAGRKRRAALVDLVFAPEHRLRDLGISHDELIQAIERRR